MLKIISRKGGPHGLGLIIGGAGGFLAALLHLPLAWMIGSMAATTLAATAGLSIKVDMRLRAAMVGVLGIMLGSSFSPDMIDFIGRWGLSVSFLIPYVTLAGGAAYFLLKRLAGYDRITAYFAAMPGGLSEMILVGGAMGGDERSISLNHAARILIVVMVIPFTFRWLNPDMVSPTLPGGSSAPALALLDWAVLIACGLVGYTLARIAKIPAAAVVGPMIASAIAHLSGWTATKPPGELTALAQVIIGTALGCRFAGVRPAQIFLAIKHAAASTLALLAVTLCFAALLHSITGFPLASLVLAFSPGGLAEMSLMAVALDVDPAFVSVHHILRIFLIVVLAPLAFRLLSPKG